MISRQRLLWMILVGLIAALAGATLFEVAMGFSKPSSADPILSVWAVAAAAFLTAIFFWWLFIDRLRKYGTRRDAIAGALAGLFAHPLAFTLQAYYSLLRNGPPEGNWGESLLSASLIGWPLSALSLLLFGWLTVPLGAAGGAILVYFFNKVCDRSMQNPTD
jgi:hypothetical protein